MRKLFSPFLLATLMCFVGQTASALEKDATGAYVINNLSDLWDFTMIIRNGQQASAKLTADIDMSEVDNWLPIGWHNHETSQVYCGTFDGQGHVIRNFHFTPAADQDCEVGFFGQVGSSTIKNLGFENARVSSAAGLNVGVLAGSVRNTTIENCYVIGELSIQTESEQQGAIAGFIDQSSTIKSSYTTHSVLATWEEEAQPKLVKAFNNEGIQSIAPTGELCFLLNGDQTAILFRQTLGQDPFPVFGENHSQVYATGQFSCDGTLQGTATYSNTPSANPIPPHDYDDEGYCQNCGISNGFIEPERDGYYHITTPEELRYVSREVVNRGNTGVKIRLMNDLDLSGIWNFPPIGIFDWPNGTQLPFVGEFDGGGHIIYNLSIENSDNEQETGLFGRVSPGGNIHDFGVVNCNINAYARAGAIAGEIHACQVKNVFSAGELNITTQNNQCCGIAGEAYQSTFINCYTTFDGPLANATSAQINCYEGINAYEMAPIGKLCWLLNGSDFHNATWFQSLGSDEFPVLDSTHGIVYPTGEEEFASATTLEEQAQMVNSLIDVEIETYGNMVATKSLIDNYIKKLNAQRNTSLETFIAAYDGMTGIRNAINESTQAYAAYTAQAQSSLAIFLAGGFEGDEVELLMTYLQEEVKPDDNFENGSYPYIINNMSLFADELTDEAAFLAEMVDEAVTKGYGTGSDITMKLQNPDFASGLGGWKTQGSVAATGGDGDIHAIALNAKMSVAQTLNDMKPGLYEFRIGAYTDIDGWTQAGRYNYADGFVHGGDLLNHVKSQGSDLIPAEVYEAMSDDEKAQFVAIGDENEFGSILGYKPSTVPGVAIGFRKGYWQNRILVKVDDELNVGISFEGPAGRRNIMFFGDAHLRYLGSMESDYSSEALDKTLADMTTTANHIVYDYVSDYYANNATDAPNFTKTLVDELKAALADVENAKDNETKYQLVQTFGDIFQRIWESKKTYTKLAQLNESVMKTCEEMMKSDVEAFNAYVSNVYEPILEMFEKGEATNEEVAAKIDELEHNDLYMMQQGIEPTLAEDGFYEIAETNNLLWLSRQTNSGNNRIKARLVNDIDLSSITNFPPIGIFDWPSGPQVVYQGEFDGQGHIIYNLNIDNSDNEQETGLFGRAQSAYLHDFGVVNANVTAYARSGVIAGEMVYCTVDNVFSTGAIKINTQNDQCSGISGEGYSSVFNNCYSTFDAPLTYEAAQLNNCYTGADALGMAATGELCFRLNGDQKNIVWYQTLGQDEYPVPDPTHAQVYQKGECDCGGNIIGEVEYTNEKQTGELPAHQYDETGLCIVCGDDLGKAEFDADGYIVISNPFHLRYFSNYVNSGNLSAKARLTEDIDMSVIDNFTMIGSYDWDNEGAARNFNGEIDGQGHVIRNLTVNVKGRVEAGFISRAVGATFRDLGFENFTINCDPAIGVRAGVLAGELHLCNIINCWSCGEISINTPHVQKGGFGGEAASSNFTGCWTTYGAIGQLASSVVNTFWGDDVAAMHQSGELCYKLNGGKVTATEWRQNLGEDPYPVLNKTHKVVFLGEDGIYTNGNSNLPRQKGTIDDPFIVAESNDLVILPDYLNEGEMNYVRLATDLDMSNLSEWEPLCNETDYSFDFDGQGHVIRNLTCSGASANNSFFGNFHGNLRNVGFENMTVSDGGSTGMIAATVGSEEEETCIEHVYVDGQLTSGATFGGGMFGKVTGPTTIRNSYAHVVINSSSTYTGGIIGQVAGQLCMENVYAAGQASKGGGIVGGGQTSDTPASQYVNVAVWSNDYGIFGHTSRKDTKNGILFYDSTNFGEMQQAVVDWDNSVWYCDMAEGSYPVLIGLADAPYSVAAVRVNAPENVIYDLMGRRISGKPTKGLYIIGGKKVLVK